MNAMMNTADMRSPFRSMPNQGTRPGYPATQIRFIKAQITRVHKDPNGLPNMIFDVLPITDGVTTGAPENQISNVTMLQPGFGNIMDTGRPPSGLIYIPEVGSMVLCVMDGSRFTIIGFYTGPSRGELTRLLDPSTQRLVTYQPGIESALNRLISPAGYDIPWLFGFKPGDVIAGKGNSRVKLCDHGVILAGGGIASLVALKTDGEIISQFTSRELRGAGTWFRHNFSRGTESQEFQNQIDASLAKPPDDAYAYACEIMETTPYIDAMMPYLVFERGHVSRTFKDFGRSAIYAVAGNQTIKEEKQQDNYAAFRMLIAKPVQKQPSPSSKTQSERVTSQKSNELKTAAYEQFDLQLDIDGSWRLRSGNTSKAKNGQGVEPTKELDLSAEYTAKTLAFLFRIGKAGAMKTWIKADPTTLKIHTTDCTETFEGSRTCTAKKQIEFTSKEFKVEAQKIQFKRGPVDIEKKLKVQDEIKTDKSVTAQQNVVAQEKVKAGQVTQSPRYTKGFGGVQNSPAAKDYTAPGPVCTSYG